MKTLLAILFAAMLAASCASFPKLHPLHDEIISSHVMDKCARVFPRKRFRAVHTIDASMPMGKSSSMMGASQVDPETRTIRAVLVSIEGVTLFDARLSRGVMEVNRAIAPFDEADFGKGLMDDVSLVLMAPAGMLLAVGRDEKGKTICRYEGPNKGVVDLLPADTSESTLERVYDKDAKLVRVAEFLDAAGPMGLAKKVVLRAPGLVGYELILSLVGAEPIPAKEK